MVYGVIDGWVRSCAPAVGSATPTSTSTRWRGAAPSAWRRGPSPSSAGWCASVWISTVCGTNTVRAGSVHSILVRTASVWVGLVRYSLVEFIGLRMAMMSILNSLSSGWQVSNRANRASTRNTINKQEHHQRSLQRIHNTSGETYFRSFSSG